MICSLANGQYFNSIAGALKAIRSWEGSGVTILVPGVDMSLGIVRESVSNQGKGEVSELSRVLIHCGDAWDTQKHLYVFLSISLQAGSVSSSVGASTTSRCFLHSSLSWWFRLWRLRQFLVVCAKLMCRGWEGTACFASVYLKTPVLSLLVYHWWLLGSCRLQWWCVQMLGAFQIARSSVFSVWDPLCYGG